MHRSHPSLTFVAHIHTHIHHSHSSLTFVSHPSLTFFTYLHHSHSSLTTSSIVHSSLTFITHIYRSHSSLRFIAHIHHSHSSPTFITRIHRHIHHSHSSLTFFTQIHRDIAHIEQSLSSLISWFSETQWKSMINYDFLKILLDENMNTEATSLILRHLSRDNHQYVQYLSISESSLRTQKEQRGYNSEVKNFLFMLQTPSH
jgi:hypothetical protein